MSGQNLMASSTIVDTDIIIDVGRGIPEAVNCMQELKSTSRLAISIVTQMELIVGCANKSDYGR
jgi:predicted nucleic acid-binding protein